MTSFTFEWFEGDAEVIIKKMNGNNQVEYITEHFKAPHKESIYTFRTCRGCSRDNTYHYKLIKTTPNLKLMKTKTIKPGGSDETIFILKWSDIDNAEAVFAKDNGESIEYLTYQFINPLKALIDTYL